LFENKIPDKKAGLSFWGVGEGDSPVNNNLSQNFKIINDLNKRGNFGGVLTALETY